MNNYGYLMTRLAELEGETLAEQEGRVEKLQELAVMISAATSPQDAQAKLELEKQSFEDNDDDWGTSSWHHRQGEKKAIAQAEEKLTQISHDLEFVPDYHPPEPQYKKEVEEWVQNKLKELGYAG